MNSNSHPVNPVSKRLRTEAVTEGGSISVSSTSSSTVSASARSQVTVSEDVTNSCANVFTDDILPVIFKNPAILTARDLLNFRLVNRCWRDAATSILLKQNMCEIYLAFGKVSYDEDGNAVARIRPRYFHRKSLRSFNYFNFHQPRSFLVDLSEIISTSPKFPSTSIRLHSGCGWGFENLVPPSQFNKDDDHKIDLFHFFHLYGKKIKKLSFSSEISKKAVQNLLYVHMPHLICLDLQDFDEFDGCFQTIFHKENAMQVCLPLPLTLEIGEIIVGHDSATKHKSTFLKELISVCRNLSALNKIETTSLGVLLELEKFHLIQDFEFCPSFLENSTIPKVVKFLTDTILDNRRPRLNLNKLTAILQNVCDNRGYEVVVKVLNMLMSASKDSLRCLEIRMKATQFPINIFIPPLPHLKFLKLQDYTGPVTTTTQFHFLGDVIGEELKAGEVTLNQSFDNSVALPLQKQGNLNIPSKYFPRLCEVKLYVGAMRDNSDKLMQFFSMDHLGPDKVTTVHGDTLESVTTLEWITYSQLNRNMANIFPNVSHLKISCHSHLLQNWYWVAFPKLERLDLSGSPIGAEVLDSFFTGISRELCAQLKSDAMSFKLNSARVKEFERTMPYIGDCENLKELKINFKHKLNSKFASTVAATNGFQDVIHRTKIIFSFEEVNLSVKEIEETRRNLDHLSPYVEIRTK